MFCPFGRCFSGVKLNKAVLASNGNKCILLYGKESSTCCDNVVLLTVLKVAYNIEQHYCTQFSLKNNCSMLLTTMNILGSTKLFNPVILQALSF